MRRIYLFLLPILLAFSSCQGTAPYKVNSLPSQGSYGKVKVKNNEWGTDIWITLASGSRADLADPGCFVFVITDADGNEIHNRQGSHSKPYYEEYKVGEITFRFWEGLHYIHFKEEPKFPLILDLYFPSYSRAGRQSFAIKKN